MRVAVHDLRGRLVRVLVEGVVPQGRHEAVWQGRDRSGRQAAAGVYFYRLESPAFNQTRRMLLVK
mgnify:CR=1 FL=1